jgi:sphinganine-1-phosphate aldolase
VQTNWPGGIYATATLAGSRPGVNIAGCWSSLLHFGLEGYTEVTRKIINATRRIEAGLRDISGIFVFGEPNVSVVAIGSDDFDVYRLAGSLNEKGWNLNNLQFPPSVHICVTYRHTEEGVVEQFLKDVSEAVHIIMQNPKEKVSGAVALYATSQQIPDRSLVGDIIAIYIDSLYKTSRRVKDGGDNCSNGHDPSSKPKRKNGELNGAVN